jgi:hypothetical protein
MLDWNSSILNAKGKIAWANDTGGAGIHLQLPTLTSAPEQLQTVGYGR